MERIAIIGSGIAGLACAWLLKDKAQITLFEKNDYWGGHTHTLIANGLPIDTGFMVFNHVTYPNLTRFFKNLKVETQATDMSFSVSHAGSGLEFCGSGWNYLFAQRKNIVSPRFWKLLMEINRFNRRASLDVGQETLAGLSISDFLKLHNFNDDFWQLYLFPMSSAVWSMPQEAALDFPAQTLVQFFYNHGFLGLYTQHPWFTVKGGAAQYVRKILSQTPLEQHIQEPALTVERKPDNVQIKTSKGEYTFDRAILANHADEALALLKNPLPQERELLSAFKYQNNTVVLHSDESVMPLTRRAWSSWNYRLSPDGNSTHYWMNRLQNIRSDKNYFVSLNCGQIAPDKIFASFKAEHPLFNLAALNAQKKLHLLNSPSSRILFSGSYFRYGFHEDAFTSSLNLIQSLYGKHHFLPL